MTQDVLTTVTLTDREQFVIARRRAQLHQRDVARLIGISNVAISRWERNDLDLMEHRVAAMWRAVAEAQADLIADGEVA